MFGQRCGLETSRQNVLEDAMQDHPRIIIDPLVLTGKPVIKGTRLAVEFVIGLLADGWSQAEIERQYPGVTAEDVAACLAYARDALGAERVYALT